MFGVLQFLDILLSLRSEFGIYRGWFEGYIREFCLFIGFRGVRILWFGGSVQLFEVLGLQSYVCEVIF